MSLSNHDLDDYIEKFKNIFHKQEDLAVNEADLWILIENLEKELELSRQREICLQNSLDNLLSVDTADITTKYVSLQETCERLEKENVHLKEQLGDLQKQTVADIQNQREEYLQTLSELENNYKCEISNIKEQLENERASYDRKTNEIYNESQLAQATIELQCDEIVSNLKRQVVDANSKLRNSQNTIRSLQMEINNLKNQLASQQFQTHSYQKQTKPEIRFDPLPVTTTRHFPIEEESESEDVEFFELPPVRDITTPMTSNGTISRNCTQHITTPLVFRGGSKIKSKPAPPVDPSVSKVKKKRKLFDPNSFDPSNIATK